MHGGERVRGEIIIARRGGVRGVGGVDGGWLRRAVSLSEDGVKGLEGGLGV